MHPTYTIELLPNNALPTYVCYCGDEEIGMAATQAEAEALCMAHAAREAEKEKAELEKKIKETIDSGEYNVVKISN